MDEYYLLVACEKATQQRENTRTCEYFMTESNTEQFTLILVDCHLVTKQGTCTVDYFSTLISSDIKFCDDNQ